MGYPAASTPPDAGTPPRTSDLSAPFAAERGIDTLQLSQTTSTMPAVFSFGPPMTPSAASIAASPVAASTTSWAEEEWPAAQGPMPHLASTSLGLASSPNRGMMPRPRLIPESSSPVARNSLAISTRSIDASYQPYVPT